MTAQEINPGWLPLGERLRSPNAEYRLIDVLGQGGFGITYLAEDLRGGQQRAIKEFFPREFAVRADDLSVRPNSSDPEIREVFDKTHRDFLRESEILKGIAHTNVVHVFEAFHAHNTAYMVMEYIQGETLADHLNASNRNGHLLSWDEIKEITSGMLDGLAQVHAKKRMHRDLKPSNIMLRQPRNIPVLIDFGSAREFDAHRSQPYTQLLTVGYSAPEIRFGPGTYAADVYSAAVVVHECLTLSPRRNDEDLVDLFRRGKMRLHPSIQDELGREGVMEFLRSVDEGKLASVEARPRTVEVFREMLFPRDGRPSAERSKPRKVKERSEPRSLDRDKISIRYSGDDDAERSGLRQRLVMAGFVGVPALFLIAAVAAILIIGPREVLERVGIELPAPAQEEAVRPQPNPVETASNAGAAYQAAARLDTPRAYNDFLRRWRSDANAATFVTQANTRIAALGADAAAAWQRLGANPAPTDLEAFRRNAKFESHWPQADAKIAEMRAAEQQGYDAASAQGTQAAMIAYRDASTTYFTRAAAQTRIEQLSNSDENAWRAASTGGLCEVDQYLDPANRHHERYRTEATTRQTQLIATDTAQWNAARQAATEAAGQTYLQQQPCGRHRSEVASLARRPIVSGTFTDACGPGPCPTMVALPGGSFVVGESNRGSASIGAFAISRTEITVAQWRACTNAGACAARTGADNFPVTGVSLAEARAYATWLSTATGQAYAIPTSRQWEYAARGGTNTPWYTGNNITAAAAICQDCGSSAPSGPSAVGGRQANGFGLLDMAGNVFEWTVDCSGDCIIRGGSYLNTKLHAQSGYVRDRVAATQQARTLGFRVVRTLQ